MNQLNRKSLLITIGVGVLAAAYIGLFFLPQMKALAATRAEVSSQQEYIAQAEKMRGTLTAVEKELVSTQEYLDHWRGECAPANQLPVLFGQISELVKASGATITRFEPSPPVKLRALERAPVVLAVTGPFASVLTLLKSLEDHRAAIWIEDVRMEGSKKDGVNVTCEVNLAIFVNNDEKSD